MFKNKRHFPAKCLRFTSSGEPVQQVEDFLTPSDWAPRNLFVFLFLPLLFNACFADVDVWVCLGGWTTKTAKPHEGFGWSHVSQRILFVFNLQSCQDAKEKMSCLFLSSIIITTLHVHCEASVCCVYFVLQLQRRGSTMSSSPLPPVGRLGLYEIKGLLLSFLHIVKTLSEGLLTLSQEALPVSQSTWDRGSKHFTKGVVVDRPVSTIQFAAVFNLAFKHWFCYSLKSTDWLWNTKTNCKCFHGKGGQDDGGGAPLSFLWNLPYKNG